MHRVLMQLSFCISCIFKPTKKSKYMYSLLVYNENHITTDSVYYKHKWYSFTCWGNYLYLKEIQVCRSSQNTIFYHVHVWVLIEMEWKRMMKNQRHKNYSEAREQSKKRILLEKKEGIGQINLSYRWNNYKSTKQWTLPRNKIC